MDLCRANQNNNTNGIQYHSQFLFSFPSPFIQPRQYIMNKFSGCVLLRERDSLLFPFFCVSNKQKKDSFVQHSSFTKLIFNENYYHFIAINIENLTEVE